MKESLLACDIKGPSALGAGNLFSLSNFELLSCIVLYATCPFFKFDALKTFKKGRAQHALNRFDVHL